jgi:hypothetical protein
LYEWQWQSSMSLQGVSTADDKQERMVCSAVVGAAWFIVTLGVRL